MRAYTLFYDDLDKMILENYVKPDFNPENPTEENSISGNYGKFNFRNSYYNEILVSEKRFNILNNVELLGDVEDEMLCMTYMYRGNSSFTNRSIKEYDLKQNTFSLFYLNRESNNITTLERGLNNNVVEIIISKRFFINLFEKYPETLESINKKICKKQSFVLTGADKLNCNIQAIIEQIKTADILGNSAPLLAEAKTLELLALLSHTDTKDKTQSINISLWDKMYEAKFIIEENYNKPPSINELAQHLGVCSTTIKENFKKVFSNTPYGYLFDYRMKRAEQLLRNNKELNIFEIALETGYEHQANFTTAFKRKFGISPKEFRNGEEVLETIS